MPTPVVPEWAARPLRQVTRGRAFVAALLVLSALALWPVLGVSNAATSPADAVPVGTALAADLTVAAKSCPTLSPARLAAQVMATTGFQPTAAGGIAGLTADQWGVWAPSADAAPATPAASVLALAHLTCDLIGQVRVSGVAGDLWQLAVAASQSSVEAVKSAGGVPATVTAFVLRVEGYADLYASAPLLGGGPPPAIALPQTTATPDVVRSGTPSPTAPPVVRSSTPTPSRTPTMPSVPAEPAPTHRTVSLDFVGYCRSTGGTGAINRTGTAYGWMCTGPGGTYGIDTAQACLALQGPGYLDRLVDYFGRDTWQCLHVEKGLLGGMDLVKYCPARGYDHTSLVEDNAYGWKCVDRQGTNYSINVYDVCHWQYPAYNPPAEPRMRDYSNRNSWECWW